MTDKDNWPDGLQLWRRVETTDPDHTKPVTFGRSFTAIDAHYQVKMATKEFGPVGEGWGYEVDYSTLELPNGEVMQFADVTLWWGREQTWEGMKAPRTRKHFGPIRGASMLVSYNKKQKKLNESADTDAPKKAMTDALTKCLSHLGFNADVFLGMFDDNKYVTKLREQKKESRGQRTKFIGKVSKATTVDEIDAAKKEYEDWINTLDEGAQGELDKWVDQQKEKLTDGSE